MKNQSRKRKLQSTIHIVNRDKPRFVVVHGDTWSIIYAGSSIVMAILALILKGGKLFKHP